MTNDPHAALKSAQKEAWATFSPTAIFTLQPAAALVRFAGIAAGQDVLDVGCGTGVVALTAAEQGARVTGIDLSPVLVEEARGHATHSRIPPVFHEGDAEHLPYADASFDVVVSQFGHMFAPRPMVAAREMLRVLKPGGRIAFSTWPPEYYMGSMFDLLHRLAPPPAGVPSPSEWGVPANIRELLGPSVERLEFGTGDMFSATLGVRHFLARLEATSPPMRKVLARLQGDAEGIANFRGQMEALIAPWFRDNAVKQSYLMTRGVKR